VALLPDNEYATLQAFIAIDPGRGDLVRGGGGIRKLRWSIQARGKSGDSETAVLKMLVKELRDG
jgi:hypothetical protein